MKHRAKPALVALAIATCLGFSCAPEKVNRPVQGIPDSSLSDGYFASPREAVPIITKLLEKRDFKTLARFYSLDGSGVQRSALESGDFFIRKKRPEMAHPGGFWRYQHPFAPGFEFTACHPGPRPGVSVVEVTLTIDQGTGPAQVGKSFFYMIATDRGWQLLPDLVEQVPAPLPVVTE